MRRKNAFLLLLLLYTALGIAGCATCFWLPFTPAAAPSAGNATLSAPSHDSSASSESSEENVLPILPQLPETVPQESAVSEDSFPAEPQYTYTAVHNSRRLFIRADASMDAEIIGFLKPGESGEVISISEEWVLLRHGELEGYVFKAYLSLEAR